MEAFGATTLGAHDNEFSNAVVVIGNAKSGVRNVAVGEQVMLNGEEEGGRDGEMCMQNLRKTLKGI